MKRTVGILCIVLGVLLLCGSGFLLYQNQTQARKAQQAAAAVMPQMVEKILQQQDTTAADLYDTQMKQVVIDGHAYVGFVTIPDLGLELPVLADWDAEKLELGTCRYEGSYKSDDLVICAHNYSGFFGNLRTLETGDSVSFTDMDGITTEYAVVATDVLSPYAVKEMTSAEYDLTLFTCTYGGGSRVTVRCDRVQK